MYALYTGFDLQQKHEKTIVDINQKKEKVISEMLSWYDKGEKGPKERPWVDIYNPFWATWYLPSYTIKEPTPILPLCIGQTEQYGYYKNVTNRSSVYDNDMVEELANPERLVNGNIDFSFMVLFLLPLLFIILTYNINGLENDLNFEKLIFIQTKNKQKWIFARLAFYTSLLIATVFVFILAVAFKNNAFSNYTSTIGALLLLSFIYVFIWAFVFYLIILKGKSSSTNAFKMIGIWLIFCVLIPGAVHQIASIKYPASYMTDYLDANRKEAYKVYELSPDTMIAKLKTIYPELKFTKHGKDTLINDEILSKSLSAITNQINKKAIEKIELHNETKNKFISKSYWYNPISMFQNKWNNLSNTDYAAFKAYRYRVQQNIDKKIKLLVFDNWEMKKVDKKTYLNYLEFMK
jgi:ABC-2 type transport system permease protein